MTPKTSHPTTNLKRTNPPPPILPKHQPPPNRVAGTCLFRRFFIPRFRLAQYFPAPACSLCFFTSFFLGVGLAASLTFSSLQLFFCKTSEEANSRFRSQACPPLFSWKKIGFPFFLNRDFLFLFAFCSLVHRVSSWAPSDDWPVASLNFFL